MSLPLGFASVVIAVTVLSETAAAGGGSGSQLKIGTVTEEPNFTGGCSLQLPSHYDKREGTYIFTSDRHDHGLINVNGVDTRVELTNTKKSDANQDPQVGDRSTYWYAGSGIEVRVDYVVTRVCPPKSKPCQTTYYDAIVTINRGKSSKTLAAKAVCGS